MSNRGLQLGFNQGNPFILHASPGKYNINGLDGKLSTTGGSGGTPAFFQNFDALPTGNTSALDNWGACQVDNAQNFSSPNSYKNHAVLGSGSFGCSKVLAAGTSTPTQGDEVWFRTRLYFPTGFDFTSAGGGGDALKFLRIDSGPAGNGHGSHIDWYLRGGTATAAGTFDFILEGVASWLYGSGPTPIPSGIVRNSWYTIECYYKLHSVASSAIIRLWVNGLLICDTSANLPSGVPQRATLNSATDVVGNASNVNCAGFMFVTYWNPPLAPATQDAWVDDFTVYCSNINGRPNATDAHGNVYIGMA